MQRFPYRLIPKVSSIFKFKKINWLRNLRELIDQDWDVQLNSYIFGLYIKIKSLILNYLVNLVNNMGIVGFVAHWVSSNFHSSFSPISNSAGSIINP